MTAYIAEFVGTLILILLGDGVVAGVLLRHSKAEHSGWIVITFGWAMAVAIAVYAVGAISGAHINPAVTVGLAVLGILPWAQVPGYIIAQLLGAFVGAVLVWITYYDHWKETDDPVLKLGVFSTIPQIRNPARDLGPRVAHAVLPIPGKGDSDWSYSWIPVVAPLVGGIIGAVLYTVLF